MKPLRTSTKVLLVVVPLALAIVGIQQADRVRGLFRAKPEQPRPVPVPAREANAAELAFVAPLVPGAKLLDYDIKSIIGVEHGGLWLRLEKGPVGLYLTIALASTADAGPLPPTVVGPYALFDSGSNVPMADAERLRTAVGAVLMGHPEVPPPPGLAIFTLGDLPTPPR